MTFEEIRKAQEALNFEIAGWIDKERPDFCWSALVMIALGYDMENWDYTDQRCRGWRESTPYAYCGKCVINGNYYKGIEEVLKEEKK